MCCNGSKSLLKSILNRIGPILVIIARSLTMPSSSSTWSSHHASHRLVPYMDAPVKEIMGGDYNITKLKRIGSGYSSVVTQCLVLTQQNVEKSVAVKTIMKEKPKITYMALSEIALLRKCRDKNVVSFESAVECRDAFIIITEYCSRGDLFCNIKYLNDISLVKEYMAGIVRGLMALHGKLVAHCDIKMKNILITDTNIIKLADFGFATQLRSLHDQIDVLNGTSDYWSPEMELAPTLFNPFPADIYALGVTFVGMLEQRAIKRKYDTIHQIVRCYTDLHQRELIQGMLTADPKNRWDLNKIQNSQWLNDVTPPPSPT